MWYPVQKVSETYIDTNEFIELINLGIITPIGESEWWNRQSRRKWPSFVGEWNELDKQIVKHERFLKFKNLIGDENLFKKKVVNLANLNSQDQRFRRYIHQLHVYPYKYNLRPYELSNWFARCFHSHRLLSDKLQSYELVAENHQAAWKYLAQTTAVEELQRVGRSESKITELLKKSKNIQAIITFMEEQDLYLPKNMTVNEIVKFREEGAAEEFRKFLENAYESAQGRYDFEFKEQLLIDFNKLSKNYKRKREIVSVTLLSLLTGTIVGLATLRNPALGRCAAAGIAGSWRIITKELQGVYNEIIGRKFSPYSWVFHLLKIR
ncbi:MAG: hypothetical protein QME61_03745 [Patescibacteria group bacterium]|nr:hypothetical protein [Patescibacteria group bacterium]